MSPHGSDNALLHLWEVVKLLLILSYGQASVERGFSFNKGLLVDSLEENSICTQVIIFDYVQFCDGVLKISFSKEAIMATQSGRRKVNCILMKEKRANENVNEKERKLFTLYLFVTFISFVNNFVLLLFSSRDFDTPLRKAES